MNPPATRLTAYSLGNNGFVDRRILDALEAEPHIRQAGVTIFASSKAEAARLYKGRKCGHVAGRDLMAVESAVAAALRAAGHGTTPSVFVMDLDRGDSAPIVEIATDGAPALVARIAYNRRGGFTFVAADPSA